MKASDLQVGDLVAHNGEVIKVSAVHTKKIGYHKTKNKLTWLFSGQFEPIVLTPEILEKNGFNSLEQIAAVEPYYWFFFDKETEVKIKAFNTIYRGLWVECVNPVNNATTYKQCEFVYEFQHVLRLCEIEKEIVV